MLATQLQAATHLAVSHDQCLVWNVFPSTQDKWRGAGLALLTPKHSRLSYHSFLLPATLSCIPERLFLKATPSLQPSVLVGEGHSCRGSDEPSISVLGRTGMWATAEKTGQWAVATESQEAGSAQNRFQGRAGWAECLSILHSACRVVPYPEVEF